MKLSVGLKPFKIEFDNGEVETIYFNPSDPDLAIRMNEFSKRIPEIFAELAEIKLGQTEDDFDVNELEIIKAARENFSKELDTAIGNPVSDSVFKYCSPFAIIGGKCFALIFIDELSKEIKKATQAAIRSFDKKTEDRLAKAGKI